MMIMTFADIEAVDAVLCEDGHTVLLYGHTPDDDETFTWSISLPMVITEDEFLAEEWSEVGWLHWMQQE